MKDTLLRYPDNINLASDASYYYYSGYYYDYYGRYIPRYYWVEYTPASKPASSLTPKSTDSEWLDFLKQRERIQGGVFPVFLVGGR